MTTVGLYPVPSEEVDEIYTYRQYYDGEFPVKLTKRQEDYLNAHLGSKRFTFGVNHCRIVVGAVISRMRVTAVRALHRRTPLQIQTGDEARLNEGATRLLEWWAERNSFQTLQADVHLNMVRDGKTFVLVEWDEDGYPRLIHVPAYSKTDDGIGVSGDGAWVEYGPDGKIRYTAREWEEEGRGGYPIRRRAFYYQDETVYHRLRRGKWERERVERNIDRRGKAVGRRLVVFDQGQSELRPIIGLQDLLNKMWVDIAAAADDAAFRTFFAFGWYPTTDGRPPRSDKSNLLAITPGSFLATMRSPSVAGVKVVDPAKLSGVLEVEERITLKIAQITGTPLSLFQSTRLTPNADTLKEMDAPLRAKVLHKQGIAGDAWRRVWQIALRMAAAYGIGYVSRNELFASEVAITWAAPEARITAGDVDVATSLKDSLHVPLDVVLGRLGFTPDVVERAVSSESAQAELAQKRLAADLGSLTPPLVAQNSSQRDNSGQGDGRTS